MKRKLVKQGASTLMVSLPSKWIKENQLDKGSEIDLQIHNNELTINASEKKQTYKEATIKITTNTESAIRTILTNAYRLGYDKIILTYSEPINIDIIKKTINNNLLGYELTNTKKESCTIENITEPSSEHAEKIFLKVLHGISELINLVEQQIQGKNKSQEIEEIEHKIKQYDNFVRRTQSKSLKQASLQWLFHSQLIHAQREIYMIYLFLKNNKLKVSNETKKFYEKLKEIYETLKEGYLKKDTKILEKIHIMEKQIIYDSGYTLIEKIKGKENIINYRIASSVRNFYLSSSPLLGIMLWQEH